MSEVLSVPQTLTEAPLLVKGIRKVKVGDTAIIDFPSHCDMESYYFFQRCHEQTAKILKITQQGDEIVVDIQLLTGLYNGKIIPGINPRILVFPYPEP